MVQRKEVSLERRETTAASHEISRGQNTKLQREIVCSINGTKPTRLIRKEEPSSLLIKTSKDREPTKEEAQEIGEKGGSKEANSNKNPKEEIKVSKAAVQTFDDDHVIKYDFAITQLQY